MVDDYNLQLWTLLTNEKFRPLISLSFFSYNIVSIMKGQYPTYSPWNPSRNFKLIVEQIIVILIINALANKIVLSMH